MRRERNLFQCVASFDNLCRAFLAASHGKRERPAVLEFEYHLETHLWQIRRELEAGQYEWGGAASSETATPAFRAEGHTWQ